MTTVNVTTQQSKVEVTSGGTTVDVASSTVATVEALTAGPSGLAQVNGTSKVNGSVVYYDGTEYKADATWTTSTLTFGGNF
jgi:nicotinamide mononucleotide (NMN) deamidase PncC